LKNQKNMKNQLLKSLLSIFSVILFTINSNGQCPTISCNSSIIVGADSNNCGAIVNFIPPVGVDTCGNSSQTFNYTGSIQTFTVPSGVTSITVDAYGAQGGGGNNNGGLGARIKGDVVVTPGQQINILVGQMGQSNYGYGGGGGSFVATTTNTPLIVAGGGGGAEHNDNYPGYDAVITNNGMSIQSASGGTAGSGGGEGLPNTSGCGWSGSGGGGFTGNGAVSSAGGGFSYINGGAGGTDHSANCVVGGSGGYGGGGCGGNAGGGGGGYSGGAGGANIGLVPDRGGGGGGSYNSGTNQTNTAGVQSGNGQVIITWNGGGTTTQTAGLASGSVFPIGTTTNTFVVTSGSFSDSCSFTVTVIDSIIPSVTCPSNVVTCNSVVNNIAPTFYDNCTLNINYTLSGATTGSGSNDASGTTFNLGVTTVQYMVSDSSGNKDSCSFTVTNNMVDTSVSRNLSTFTSNETGATYQWLNCDSNFMAISGVTNQSYTATTNGSYAVVVSKNGCTDTSACQIINNVGITNVGFGNISIYPNPTNGLFTIDMGSYDEAVNYTVSSIDGRIVTQKSNVTDNKIIIDLGNESKGVYLLKLYNTKSSGVFRITRL
jgi:hypothetical protein